MKELKIGYISDEHIDFYVNPSINGPKLEEKIKKFIEIYLKPEGGDILLSAGDTSHYNEQSFEYLKQMTEYYTDVFVVPGNHDLYLINNNQRKKYNVDSFQRIQEMKEFCEKEEHIHYMEGVIEVQGIKIGGFGNWYNLPNSKDIERWKVVMNDSNLIMNGSVPKNMYYNYNTMKFNVFDTQKYYEKMKTLLYDIVTKKCDILMCHICPIIIPDEFMDIHYVGDPNNIFYGVDQFNEVKESGAEVVIYGHSHYCNKYEIDDIEFRCNPLGYPSESGTYQIEHFNFYKE